MFRVKVDRQWRGQGKVVNRAKLVEVNKEVDAAGEKMITESGVRDS